MRVRVGVGRFSERGRRQRQLYVPVGRRLGACDYSRRGRAADATDHSGTGHHRNQLRLSQAHQALAVLQEIPHGTQRSVHGRRLLPCVV